MAQTIDQWLAEIGMERYAPLFEAQHIELDVIAHLTDADLKEIGIAALGDRKRILGGFDLGTNAFADAVNDAAFPYLTSNLDFSRWIEVFGDPSLTAALLDRLTASSGDLSRSSQVGAGV